ncbi:MAG: hypothetical protein K0A93_09050 [Desulfuromonadaceae bacterium]|nr:hypothetical protein [Desulfuromonadaceae bacterium]
MKIGVKLLVLWAASLTLYICAGLATWQAMEMMDGVTGLAIRFFLGYCGIIVVSQVFSSLTAINQLFRDIAEKRPESIRALLR